MALEVRAITEAELPAMLEADRRGFGMAPRKPEQPDSWVRAHLDRTRCAFDGAELVASSRAYPFELTVPGGAMVAAAAISAVAVQPSHRRRGVLTGMMEALRRDAAERGEPAAMLTASESIIYGRFGYGLATWRVGCAIERAHARLSRSIDDPGRVRMIDPDETLKLFPEVYERARPLRAGMVTRPEYWWPECYWAEPDHTYFDVVHEDEHGELDGYAAYEITGGWEGGLADRRVTIHDLQSTNALARAALWQYLLGVDLVATVSAANVPVDEPLRFMLADSRRFRVEYVNDGLWVLPIDIRALLDARSYATSGRIALEVDGERFEIDSDDGHATVSTTTRSVELSCSRAALGAAYLGGNTWTTLAGAGLVDEHTPGALARADLMFATSPAAATLSWF
jgi:predicted acetyltransferase